MAANIPKFTSFRPKLQAPAEASKKPDQTEKPRESNISKSSRVKSRDKKSDAKSKRDDGASVASKEQPSKLKDEKRSLTRDAEPSKLFFSDRRGDPDIVKYGSINRYDVPTYRSYGYGCILGLPSDRKIDRNRSTDKEIVVTPARRRRQERLLASRHTEKDGKRSLRFLKTAKETQDVDADFIPISTSGKRKREEDDGNVPEDDYRGFQEEGSATKPPGSDAEYDSDTLVSTVDAEITGRNSELVRRTHEHPENVEAWLELARHQEAMMRLDRPSTALSVSDKQHLADIRISTYEQALKKVSKHEDSIVELYAALMSEARRAWNVSKQITKWAEILERYPHNEGLWVQYLNFVQSSFTDFKYESCRATFFRCLHTIRVGYPQVSVELLLYILVRLTSMIYQAGYQELAIAVWQALLEFHLLKTEPLDNADVSRSFEEFWESEEPRIGEVNAKGWRAFNADNDPSPPTGAKPLHAQEPSDSLFEDFYKRELDSAIKLRYPGRTMDEVGEDDAFHIVLYSDVEDFLRILPQDTPNSLLLSAFLRFCQLPTLLRTLPSSSKWLDDPFLLSESRKPSPQEESTSFSKSLAKYSSCPFGSFEMSIELLVDRGLPETIDNIDAAFVRRVLKLLVVDDNSEDAIGEYLLAFEAKYFPTEAFKTAKKLLKARPSSLRLYNAYGLVESRCGNSAKADQVFSAALSMQMGVSPHSTPGMLDLLSNWTWEALRRGDPNEALWRLVSPTGQVQKTHTAQPGPDQGALLRARSALSDTKERALLANIHTTAVEAASLLALLIYLSSGQDPDAALVVHHTLSTWFAQRNLSQSPAAELHAQSTAQLLTYHATHAPIVKPALLRKNLEPLIASFPNNTTLLSLYAANESRFSIDDRVRSIMHQNTLSSPQDRTIVGWTFAIHYEALKGEIAGSTSHSIRALYKKAEDDVGAHSTALWKLHILFELEEASKERAIRPTKKPRRDGKKRKEESRVEEAYRRVKETFFKGMTQLPWCKEYMMMAFTHLGEEFFSGEELRKVYNVMVEKELRLYAELGDGV